MVKKLKGSTKVMSLVKDIDTRCNSCDLNFSTEAEFKDHILTTIHKGLQVKDTDGGRHFDYKLTSKKAKYNLRRGARREHFSIEHKQGASNVDFSDGTWLLVAFPEVLK